MLDFARLSGIDDALCQSLAQAQPFVTRFEQNRPAVATCVRLIELHHEGLFEQIRKQHRLSYGIFGHARAFGVTEVLVVKLFLSQQRLLLPPFSHRFVHFPG
jgi:hypothetical protein